MIGMIRSNTDISVRLNSWLVAGMLLLLSAQLWLLPLLVAQHAAWSLLVLLLLPLSLTCWAVIHEAIHGLLHPGKKTNEWLGRVLCMLFGVAFDIARYGHLMHHQLNRRWESEYYNRGKMTRLRANIGYYLNLFGGLYITELGLSFVVAVLPKQTSVWLMKLKASTKNDTYQQVIPQTSTRYFVERGGIGRVRVDTLGITLIYGSAFWLYGAHWPLLVAIVLLRAFVISVHDNSYHYATPRDNSVAAQEFSLHPALSKLFLHINYHNTHHHHAKTPWSHLPALSKEEPLPTPFFLGNLRQFRGPIGYGPGA